MRPPKQKSERLEPLNQTRLARFGFREQYEMHWKRVRDGHCTRNEGFERVRRGGRKGWAINDKDVDVVGRFRSDGAAEEVRRANAIHPRERGLELSF
jgi:hypothetical protein